MRITVVDPSEIAERLPEALTGRAVLAAVGNDDDATLAMLRPELDVEPDTAVVVATSGSSGRPKGVRLSARALLAAAESAQQVTGPMVWTAVLPDAYVAGLMVHVRAHVAGTRVLRASSSLRDLDPLPGHGNAISIVPTQLFRAMADTTVLQGLARYDLVLLGGAAVDPELLGRARELGLNLVTTYGMSETCGGCVWDGRPLPGVEVGVDGSTGRISLSGPMAFSGYRLDPELSAATLRGTTVLTNDRGRLTDGCLEVLGRLDEVVISGGVNVDLSQVQRAVEGIEPATSVVIALPDPEWGQRICLVTSGERSLEQWQRLLRPVLGAAALPRQLFRVDVLPLTSSGKIDRQMLVARFSC